MNVLDANSVDKSLVKTLCKSMNSGQEKNLISWFMLKCFKYLNLTEKNSQNVKDLCQPFPKQLQHKTVIQRLNEIAKLG